MTSAKIGGGKPLLEGPPPMFLCPFNSRTGSRGCVRGSPDRTGWRTEGRAGLQVTNSFFCSKLENAE